MQGINFGHYSTLQYVLFFSTYYNKTAGEKIVLKKIATKKVDW